MRVARRCEEPEGIQVHFLGEVGVVFLGVDESEGGLLEGGVEGGDVRAGGEAAVLEGCLAHRVSA